MHPEVGVGMSLGPLRHFREPGTRNEDAGGGDPVFVEGLEDGGVHGVHHAQVVSVNYQEARIGGVTKALGESVGAGRRRLLSDGRQDLAEKKNEAKQTE
jgi:hypothetical protein